MFKKRLKIWLGVILDYGIKFGVPLGVTYWKFAIHKEGVGGSFFFFIAAIIFIAFYAKLSKIIKKQKASVTKIVFKTLKNVITGGILYVIVNYIGVNFTQLIWVVLSWIGAYLIGSVIEIMIVNIDNEYINEIGVI